MLQEPKIVRCLPPRFPAMLGEPLRAQSRHSKPFFIQGRGRAFCGLGAASKLIASSAVNTSAEIYRHAAGKINTAPRCQLGPSLNFRSKCMGGDFVQ
jgi:hypothetical protein